MEAYIYILIFFSVFILIEVVTAIRLLSKDLPSFRRVTITFRINLFILFTGIIMLGVAVLFDVNYIFYRSPIPHDRWKEVTIKDFVGLKRPGQTLDGSSDFAFIVSSTTVSRKGDGYEVVAWFHPSRSYVFNSEIADTNLLRHELYHWHIREYCARVLRKDLSEGADPETAEASAGLLENDMQIRYDDESYHSYVNAKQVEWEKRVDSLLKDLDTFAPAFVRINKK